MLAEKERLFHFVDQDFLQRLAHGEMQRFTRGYIHHLAGFGILRRSRFPCAHRKTAESPYFDSSLFSQGQRDLFEYNFNSLCYVLFVVVAKLLGDLIDQLTLEHDPYPFFDRPRCCQTVCRLHADRRERAFHLARADGAAR